jgi:hypothetical protein
MLVAKRLSTLSTLNALEPAASANVIAALFSVLCEPLGKTFLRCNLFIHRHHHPIPAAQIVRLERTRVGTTPH